jgi:hypothetical protein
MDPQIDEQVAKLLAGLKKVEAPQNFESRVRSRLASPVTEPARFGFLKLAFPAAALSGLALFLLLSGYLGGDVPQIQVAAMNEQPNSPKIAVPEAARVTQDQQLRQQQQPQPNQFLAPEVADTKTQPQSPLESLRSQKRNKGGGSYDIGAGSPGDPINAKGFDPNSRAASDPAAEKQMRRPSILASDILRYIGLNAEYRGTGWVVDSIAQNSVADRAGLKAGDVVIGLNDVRIGQATAFPSGVDIKLIRVSRNGSVIDLKTQPLITRGTK